MPLKETLTRWRGVLQRELFPWLEEEVGALSTRHRQLVTVLEMTRIEDFVPGWCGIGRPPSGRAALAAAFVAKAIFQLPSTRALIDRLQSDKTLRRLCGFARLADIPDESTFSRVFGDFAASGLPARVHEALIEATLKDRLVGHISRDSTAIPAREKAARKEKKTARPKRGRGRPKKGEVIEPKAPSRMERQKDMSLDRMLADLPKLCDIGTKRNAKGFQESWKGYSLHMDVADGGVPVSCILTSASLHDSQAAIPLAVMSAGRVTNLYDLMDSAYNSVSIHEYSRSLGHVPIIDVNPRRDKKMKDELAAEARRRELIHMPTAEQIRYRERSTAERANGRLKDDYGALTVRVRGHDKVFCHLMFAVLVLTVEQLLRLIP